MRYKRQHAFPRAAECVIRYVMFPVFRLLWRPKYHGGRYFPFEKPCFVYGNHSHNFDPFITNMFTRAGDSTAGVLTQEYFRGRVMNWAMHNIDLLPTRKHVPEPSLIRGLYKMIDQGHSILIYPEGGRRWNGRELPWIESTAKIFIKSGLPIYPIRTYGSYIAWPRWATYPRPARIVVEMQEPLIFERKAPFEEALAKLKAAIDFDETMMPDELKPKWAYKPAAGIHRLLYRDPESGENGGLYTPDGTYVQNRIGTIRYKMLPDSTLLNEKTGEVISTADIHEQIKTLPITFDAEKGCIQNNVVMHIEHAFPHLKPAGKVTATLHEDAVHIKGATQSWTFPLEEIFHAGVERNRKLQMFMKDQMVQLSFLKGDGSALQWEETFARIKAGSLASSVAGDEASKPAAAR